MDATTTLMMNSETGIGLIFIALLILMLFLFLLNIFWPVKMRFDFFS